MKSTQREREIVRSMKGTLNELALFAGAGGGILGTHLLGTKVVAAVEIDEHCERVLMHRQADCGWGHFPVWNDCRTFDGHPFRGLVDVVSAGFPCPPFSCAGKQKAAEDKRNMWPETARILREVRPAVALLENVDGLLSRGHGYFQTVVENLIDLGFDIEWSVLSAAAIGARHRRKRLWILAYSVRNGAREVLAQLAGEVGQAEIGARRRVRAQPGNGCDDVADASIEHRAESRREASEPRCCRPDVADSEYDGDCRRSSRSRDPESTGALSEVEGCGGVHADANGQRFSRGPQRDCEPIELGVESSRGDDSGGLRDHVSDSDSEFLRQQLRRRESGARETVASDDGQAATRRVAEPGLGGMADGMADRLDAPWENEPADVPRVASGVRDRVARLRSIGNGQVPLCAAVAWRLLARRALEVIR